MISILHSLQPISKREKESSYGSLTDEDICPIVKEPKYGSWSRVFSPEEWVQGGQITTASESAALGSIYYVLLTGHDPFAYDYIADDSNVTLHNTLTGNEIAWINHKRVRITDDDFSKMLENKVLPPMPMSLMKSDDPNIKFLIQLVNDCRQYNPKDRPSIPQLLERFKRFFADSPKSVRRIRRRR